MFKWILVLKVTFLALRCNASCPRGYTPLGVGGVCYSLHSESTSWADARDKCKAEDIQGHLISLVRKDVFYKIREFIVGKGDAWVGASDLDREGTWKWLNGMSVNSQFWGRDEPNNLNDEDCGQMFQAKDYYLNDNGCSKNFPFLCEACKYIENCERLSCNAVNEPSHCSRCVDNNYFFKRTTSNTKCERMCAWNNHYCWPGTCVDDLTKNCRCSDGFTKVSSSTETSCQLSHLPSTETCNMRSIGPNGEMKMALSESNMTACQYLKDYYANFKPIKFRYELLALFQVNTSQFPTKPGFIDSYNFGVTDVRIQTELRNVKGTITVLQIRNILVDSTNSRNARSTYRNAENIPVSYENLQNGESLCLRFIAHGGGFLTSIDTSKHDRPHSPPLSYRKTTSRRMLCHIYDDAPPVHCLEVTNCSEEPLKLEARISRHPNITVYIQGWIDPIPYGGQDVHASSIESYEVRVNEVSGSNDFLKVGTKVVFTEKLPHTETFLTLDISSDEPKLFCVTLEVKDVADNVRHARRFYLYDNSSFITSRDDKPFYVSSASRETNYVWQISHDDKICLNWTDHFYNRFYLDNHLLSRIESDPHGLVTGIYEQNDGILPVSGTPNVYGIVGFAVAFSINGVSFSTELQVPKFLSQIFCKRFNVSDGDTYTFHVTAVDVVNNTFSENRTVYIDKSKPAIANVWLVKDSIRRIYVHDQTDLSSMDMQFDGYDQHSGIKTVEWVFGTSDDMDTLASGSIGVTKVNKSTCSPVISCYCPVVGESCEIFRYAVPLHSLIAENKHIGNHNRRYFFSLTVTNIAGLISREQIEILVDDSPPETGVVLEGPEDDNDMDYTSDDSFLVHWHGFVDHESGIKLFRIALTDHCLSKQEVYFMNTSDTGAVFKDIYFPENKVRLPAMFTGKRYVTLIAINNAMDASEPVCTDGITRDAMSPEIRNITIRNARWSESFYCEENKTWLLRYDLVRVPLYNDTQCRLFHKKGKSADFIQGLPVLNRTMLQLQKPKIDNSSEKVDLSCKDLPEYNPTDIIYIPNDHIFITWDVLEGFSQIQDFYIGFGSDISQKNAPGLIEYSSLENKRFYVTSHLGVGTDKEFYIFLKVTNKARLETIIPIGPLMIDQTAPRYKSLPEVRIVGSNLIVGWEADTFYDEEQTAGINKLAFQLGQASRRVTQLMEWLKCFSKVCLEFTGGCFIYPLEKLQRMDIDLGLNFYFTIYAYNNAGHFISLKTREFRLPSKYPPGHAVITDLDPADKLNYNLFLPNHDVSFHFAKQSICASWNGFRHHEKLELEFGIGSVKGTDNIYNFTSIQSTNYYCITSAQIPDNIQLFVSVRASCSGGSTVSSSNGVIIYDRTSIMDSFKILDGPECFTEMHRKWLFDIQSTLEKNEKIRLNHTLSVGQPYTIRFRGVNISTKSFALQGLKVLIKNTEENQNYVDFIIQPFSAFPEMTLSKLTNYSIFVSNLELYDCVDDVEVQMKRNSLTVHWRGIAGPFACEITALRHTCEEALNESCIEYITPFRTILGNSTTIAGLYLQPHQRYYVGARLCVNSVCTQTKLSTGVEIESESIGLAILEAEIDLDNSNCTKIHLQWETAKVLRHSQLYQWSIMSKTGKTRSFVTLIEWKTYSNAKLNNANALELQLQECVRLPVHSFRLLYACIRTYSITGMKIEACKTIDVVTSHNAYSDTVYEFDANSISWSKLKESLHSLHLGDKLSEFHEEDLDFAKCDTKVVGATLHGTERNITWFLMRKSKYVKTTCELDAECLFSTVTSDGFVEIPDSKIQCGIFYFICAIADETSIIRESITEILPSVNLCSNGFVLDDTPPFGGKVAVENVNGFINDLNDVTISWKGFTDNIDAQALGYQSSLKSYSIEVGSSPYSSEFVSYEDVRDTELLHFETPMLEDGMSLYISVIAFDHVGFYTRAMSDELIVDTSPPVTGQILIETQNPSIWLSGAVLRIRLSGFFDRESSINYFLVFVGSSTYTDDIIQEIKRENISFELLLPAEYVMDGFYYYVAVKAVNMAGLFSKYIVKKFGVDQSPPTGGHIVDGLKAEQVDVDYQVNINFISGHWKGFTDPHSGIAYYRVGLGSSPFLFDIEPKVYIGLRTDMMWNSSFTPGTKYFITVESCNGADLCRSLSSDGIVLDGSPPIPGLVHVGSNSYHQTYIPQNSSMEIFWTNFEDPESGMGRYEVCIGTAPYLCNVSSVFDSLLSTSCIKTGLSLTENTKMYVTVTGYNNAELSVSVTSKYFLVDVSPPRLEVKPSVFSDPDKKHKSIHWEKSFVKIVWKFIDLESPIVRHVATLSTHHEGHTPLEQLELGNVNELTISLDDKNWLHNGDTYRVLVTACNAAGLCSSAFSDNFTIDATPPHLGGFKDPMTWHNFMLSSDHFISSLSLTWFGFHDQESGIRYYYVGVGRSFTGNELTDGLIQIENNMTSAEQIANLNLSEPLMADEKVIVSIMAENNVGLLSSVARVTLETLVTTSSENTGNASGIFEIEKHSCDIHFCNKDCTCAVIGKPCISSESNLTCNGFNETSVAPVSVSLRVYNGLKDNEINITPSSACLSAHWTIVGGASFIKRFEWSMGIRDHPYGEGIFDLKNERQWTDIGKRQSIIHCLPLNRSLIHSTEYVTYVRAWIAMDTFYVFESLPVVIDHTPPAVRRGKFLKDSDIYGIIDYDIIDWTDKMSASWADLFYEPQGIIVYYKIGLGTVPGADDIISYEIVGLNTSFQAEALNLSHGHRYFFTVTAYNNVGFHTSVSSDGFVVDLDKPVPGIVYNTGRQRNYGVQASVTTFDLSWHGFLDQHSGIKAYYAALLEESEPGTFMVDFVDCSIKTSFTFSNLSLQQGKTYYGAVKAIDSANHESDIVFSSAKLIDNTAPRAYTCVDSINKYNETHEMSNSALMQFSVDFKIDTMYSLLGTIEILEHISYVTIMVSSKFGHVLTLEELHDGTYRFSYNVLSNLQGTHNITIQVSPVPVSLLKVSVNECQIKVENDLENALSVKQVSSTLFKANLRVIDPESSIKRILFGAGTTPTGFQLKPLSVIDTVSDEIFPSFATHRTPMYATAVVENYAGLRSVFRSKMLLVDHTPPILENITVELKYITQERNTTALPKPDEALVQLGIRWTAQDEETQIKLCYVAIGRLPFSTGIQSSTAIFDEYHFNSSKFTAAHGSKLYVTVKCVNNVELSAADVSDATIVSVKKPESMHAKLTFIPSSPNCIPGQQYVLGSSEMAIQTNKTSLHFFWDKFEDLSGIDHYEYRLSSDVSNLTEWTSVKSKRHVALEGFTLDDGKIYEAEVRAVNIRHLRSDAIGSKILVESRPPHLSGEAISISARGREVTMDWKNVFTTNPAVPTTYDVTVGSSPGYSDLWDSQSLSNHNLSVLVPTTSIITESIQELFIRIACIYSTGQQATYHTHFKLST